MSPDSSVVTHMLVGKLLHTVEHEHLVRQEVSELLIFLVNRLEPHLPTKDQGKIIKL